MKQPPGSNQSLIAFFIEDVAPLKTIGKLESFELGCMIELCGCVGKQSACCPHHLEVNVGLDIHDSGPLTST